MRTMRVGFNAVQSVEERYMTGVEKIPRDGNQEYAQQLLYWETTCRRDVSTGVGDVLTRHTYRLH